MSGEEAPFPSLNSIAEQTFQEIKLANRVTDDQLASLHLLFGGHFEKATQIVDRSGVFLFTGRTTQRKVYQVQGHRSKDLYTVFPRHFCSCQSFFFDVATKGEAVYCKHQLAVQLADALQQTRDSHVDDLVISEILEGSLPS